MTKRFKFVALVNSAEGRDEDFNTWHTETHLPEVARAAGFLRAERMRLVDGTEGEGTRYQYLVMFEGESENPMESLEKLGAAMADQQITMSDSLGQPLWSSLFEEIPDAVYIAE